MEKMRVQVTVQHPDASGSRASTWVVVTAAGRQVRNAPGAVVPNDPQGVHAGHQGRLWVQAKAVASGDHLELDEIPIEVSELGSAGGVQAADCGDEDEPDDDEPRPAAGA